MAERFRHFVSINSFDQSEPPMKKLVELNLRYSKAFEADFWLSAVIGSASQLDGYQSQKISAKRREEELSGSESDISNTQNRKEVE